jgi:LacI family transcriptional regulator
MRRSNAITLKDVAQEAGVAKMTASVVLNGARSGTQVSEATRARILEAAQRLGYRPNGVARGLSRRRMDILGVVAACGSGGLQQYFLEVFNGIVTAASRHGQSATVFTVPGWDDPVGLQRQLLHLCDGRVDGLIILGPHHLDESLADSLRQHIPLVAIHAEAAPSWLCNVDVDNEAGIYAAVRHLIGLGHRRIAHLPGKTDPPYGQQAGARQRLAGYCRGLEEAGIPFDPALVPHGHYSFESGQERTEQLLDAEGGSMPTAICCANDAIALGCLAALAERGLRTPEDISVTGFDDILTTVMITPLTTVRQPFFQLGQRAVELLLKNISESQEDGAAIGDATPPACSETLPVELIVRKSTGPPRARPE